MKTLLFHFFFCSLLLFDNYTFERKKLKKFYKRRSSEQWVKQLKSKLNLKKYHIDENDRKFIYTLITGKKASIRKHPIYKKLQKSQMLHLLTPSGLHLSSLFLFFYLFLKTRFQKISLMFIFSPFLFLFTDFSAAKRVFFLKLCTLLKLPIKFSFYLVFIMAYLIKPNLSVLLSFLFIGVLIHNPYKTIFAQIFFMHIAQIIVSLYFTQSYYIYSIFINSLGSFYIALIFPWIILTAIIPSIYTWSTSYILVPFYGVIDLIQCSPRLF